MSTKYIFPGINILGVDSLKYDVSIPTYVLFTQLGLSRFSELYRPFLVKEKANPDNGIYYKDPNLMYSMVVMPEHEAYFLRLFGNHIQNNLKYGEELSDEEKSLVYSNIDEMLKSLNIIPNPVADFDYPEFVPNFDYPELVPNFDYPELVPNFDYPELVPNPISPVFPMPTVISSNNCYPRIKDGKIEWICDSNMQDGDRRALNSSMSLSLSSPSKITPGVNTAPTNTIDPHINESIPSTNTIDPHINESIPSTNHQKKSNFLKYAGIGLVLWMFLK